MRKKRLLFFASQIITTTSKLLGVISRSNQIFNQSTMQFDSH